MNKKLKVLILLTDTGGGHRSAAVALQNAYFSEFPGKYEVEILDIQKEIGKFPFKYQPEMHNLLSSNRGLESLYNIIARTGNREFIYPLVRKSYSLGALSAAQEQIEKRKPDLVICTHSVIAMMIRRILENGGKFKYAVVITDLVTLFKGWLDPSADLVVAPTPSAIEQAREIGLEESKLRGPLFPINPKLADYRPRSEVIEELDFSQRKKTVLLMGGGAGILSMRKGIHKLALNTELQLIIITGGVWELESALKRKYRSFNNVRVLGFVKNIQDYLNASDLVVTKPGPASVLEVELFNKLCVLTRKVGFQEVGNIDYALENPNFRYVGAKTDLLVPTVLQLLDRGADPEFKPRRSFDESFKIVRELDKLIAPDYNE